MARANDPEHAGVLRNGVLSHGSPWSRNTAMAPADERGVALPADAFGEEGKPSTVPGPLIRAKVGTRVEASVRDALPKPSP